MKAYWSSLNIMWRDRSSWTQPFWHWGLKKGFAPSKEKVPMPKFHLNNLKFLIPIGLFSVFNILNYLFSTSFSYKFPVVDVVTLLDQSGAMDINGGEEVRVISDNSILHDVLKDIYLRKEQGYLAHFQEYTVIVQPGVIIDAKAIELVLKEGFYDFAHEKPIYGELGIETSITKITSGKGNYFDLGYPMRDQSDRTTRQFINEYLYPLYTNSGLSKSTYSIDSLLKPFYLIRAGNLGIMVATILLSISLFTFTLVTRDSKPWLYSITSITATSGVCYGVFSFFNLIIISIIDSGFGNVRGHFSILFYLMQTLLSVAVLMLVWSEVKKRLQSNLEETAVTTITSQHIGTMVDGSSCYSNSTLEIDMSKKTYAMDSTTSLDPLMKQSIRPMTNIYQGSIQLPKTANLSGEVPERLIPVARNYTAPVMLNHKMSGTPDIINDATLKRREVGGSPKSLFIPDSFSLIGKESTGRTSSRFAEEGDIN